MQRDAHADREDFANIYFDDKAQEEIFNLFRRISENTGAAYMSYVYENLERNIRYAFTTNPDWGKYYVGDHKIDSCHLWLNVKKYFLSTNKKKYILLWDSIKPETQKQRSIYFDRTDHELGINGISFCSRFEDNRELLALVPDLKTPKFQHYVSKNIDVIRTATCRIRNNLSKIITPKQTENPQ